MDYIVRSLAEWLELTVELITLIFEDFLGCVEAQHCYFREEIDEEFLLRDLSMAFVVLHNSSVLANVIFH